MHELWLTLPPILLADIVNPVLFAFMVYAVGTTRPLAKSLAVLLGHTMAYLAFGVLFAVAFNVIAERITNPEPIDYWISLVIGLLLLWVAWRSRSTDSMQTERSADAEMSLIKAFSMGGVINLIGIPFALPYFAAIDQVLKADLSATGSLSVVIVYNIAYALPFLVVPLLALVMGEASRPVLARISNKVDRISAVLMPVMLLLVGLFLIVDAVSYFTTGEGLI